MSYRLTITEKPGYLHATVTGLNSRENLACYLVEVLRACMARGCRRVLIEERLEGPRLGPMDVFQIASEGSRNVQGYLKTIAYFDANSEGGLMDFAETVAVNRGLRVRVFSSVADAEKWMRSETGCS